MRKTSATRKPALPVPRSKAPEDAVEFITDIEQGSPEWFELRRGIITASNFAAMMAEGDGKTRGSYMRRLAAEIITGEVIETYRNADMERGNAVEPEVRDYYSRTHFADLAPVGFVRRTFDTGFGTKITVGCSPDSLIGKDGTLEIKSMRGDLLIAVLEKGAAGLPTEHRAQCHGTLWITGRQWCDLVIYCRGLPSAQFRLVRDEVYIGRLRHEAERFHFELQQLVSKIRKMGAP